MTYNSKNLLIKRESLNNHIPDTESFFRTCHGSAEHMEDYVTNYIYDHKGLNTIQLKYIDEAIRYNKIDGVEKPIAIIRKKLSDNLKLALKTEINYNSKQQAHTIINKNYYSEKKHTIDSLLNEYNDKNLIISSKTIHHNANIFHYTYKYSLINNNWEITSKDIIKHKNDETTTIPFYKIHLLQDGNFKRIDYNNYTESSVKLFDPHYNIIEHNLFNSPTVTTYLYDNKNNWISKSVFSNGKIVEDIKREIVYYN
jgi:hypothetical protein